jgi:uncharacterized glyoxalase superfamily protein PhnB
MTQVQPIPEGFGTVTPNLVVADGAAAIAFHERAFGAHAGADALHAPAPAAGATAMTPVADHVHGDRAGSVRDPFGHREATATHVRDVREEEIAQRLEAMS